MKLWIARTPLGTLSLHNIYPEYIADLNDSCWIGGHILYLDDRTFPEVTLENSPMEVELKIKHNEMRFSPMFRLFDRIVIKDPSDRKRIVKYTEKLIDKLKEEGFYADAKCAEEYLKVFNGELVELVIKKKEQD